MKRFLKVIDCTQQLQVRENVVGFEKALGAVKVIKDQIQYRSQSLLNLVRGYVRVRQRKAATVVKFKNQSTKQSAQVIFEMKA